MKKSYLLFIAYFCFLGLAFAQPANDNPQNAIDLTMSFSCNSITGTNLNATASEVADPTIPAPGCASYQGNDVWFKFIVPPSGDVTVRTTFVTGSDVSDSDIALYSGNIGAFVLEAETINGW